MRNKISTSWGRCQMPSEVLHGLQRRSSSCELSSPLSSSIVELITWADSRASCNNQRNRVLFPAVTLLYYKTKSNRIQSVRPPTFSFWVRCGSTSILMVFLDALANWFLSSIAIPQNPSVKMNWSNILSNVKCKKLNVNGQMLKVKCKMLKVKCQKSKVKC